MLGYTEKMRIDGNAFRILGLDDYPSMDDVRQYEQLYRDVRAEFPALSEELDPFHLQVVFDWQRSSTQNGDTAAGS